MAIGADPAAYLHELARRAIEADGSVLLRHMFAAERQAAERALAASNPAAPCEPEGTPPAKVNPE